MNTQTKTHSYTQRKNRQQSVKALLIESEAINENEYHDYYFEIGCRCLDNYFGYRMNESQKLQLLTEKKHQYWAWFSTNWHNEELAFWNANKWILEDQQDRFFTYPKPKSAFGDLNLLKASWHMEMKIAFLGSHLHDDLYLHIKNTDLNI